jgi:hypothetical protein
MHEHEHEKNACLLRPCHNGAVTIKAAENSIETSRGALKLLYDPHTAVRPLRTVLGACLCALRTSQTSIVALKKCD